jgi:hypothetical protein
MILRVLKKGWPTALFVIMSFLLLRTGNLQTVFGLGFWSYELYQYWTFFLGITALGVVASNWFPRVKYPLLAMLCVIFSAATFRVEVYMWLSYLVPMDLADVLSTTGVCLATAAVVTSIAIQLLRNTRLALFLCVAIILSLAPVSYSNAKIAFFKATSNHSVVPTLETTSHVS